MLWTRPLAMLPLLALLLLSELVRTGFVVSALPVQGPALGLSPATVGLMVSAHYLADALGRGPMGLVSERWGLGRVLLLGGLLGLLTLGLTFWWPSALGGVVLSALWGLLFGALWPGVMNASHAFAHPARVSRALAVSNLSVAPAILAGVLLVGPLMQQRPQTGWTLLLAAQALTTVLGLALWRLRVPGAEPLPHSPWQGWGRVAALLPAAFAQTLAPGLLVTLVFPLLAHYRLHLHQLVGPGILAGATFGLALWQLGRVADRIRPQLALTPGLLGLALSFGLLALTTPQSAPERLWWLAPLLGASYGAFLAGWNGLVARTLPGEHRAAAWGTVMAVEALGYALGPVLGGAAWQIGGPAGVFGLGALVFLLAEGYSLGPGRRVLREHKSQATLETSTREP